MTAIPAALSWREAVAEIERDAKSDVMDHPLGWVIVKKGAPPSGVLKDHEVILYALSQLRRRVASAAYEGRR